MININLDRDYGPLKQNFSDSFRDGYNVLVGPNNSGKSSIIQYIFQHLVREVGDYGPGKVVLLLPERIYVDLSYETGGRKLIEHNGELANKIATSPLEYYTYSSPPRSELSKLILTHIDLIGQNNTLNRYLEKLGLPKLIIGPGQNISFDTIPVGFQGSGLRSLLAIVAALTDPEIKVLLVDEPELSLEPKVQKLLRDLLLEASSESDKLIIVTTHSHLFLNRKDVTFNKIVRKEDGVTRVKGLENNTELYNLTFSLLGNNLSDLFFPENFLIVEGSSDQMIINRILDLKKIDKAKIKVVSASGVEKIGNKIDALFEALLPLIINESPYKSRVVVLIDQKNINNSEKVEELSKELGNRLFELNAPSIEEYLSEALYSKAGRNRQSDLDRIEELKNNYNELANLKKEISTKISSVLEESDLSELPIIIQAIEKAIQKGDGI